MASKPRFNLRPGEPGTILLIFRYNGNRVVLSTSVSVPQKFWDYNKQRVKNTRAFPHSAKINAMLNRLESQCMEIHYSFKTVGIVPSPSKFKAALKAKIEQREDSVPTVIEFIQHFIEEREAMNRPKGSIQVYKNCLKHLQGYSQAKKKILEFETITEAWKNDFLSYLFTLKNPEGQNFSDSYVNKILGTLRTFLKDAFKRGIIQQDIAGKVKLSIQKREAENIYLSEKEIAHLFSLEGLSERLEKVRDLFVIGCLTGLRFSDYTTIQPQNIQQVEHGGRIVPCLVMTTQKTKQKVVLPVVNPMLVSILEKYNMQAPPALSNQKLNKYLKELGKIAGFSQKIEVNEFRAGQHSSKTVEKWELISTHTARRSFATNAFKRGMTAADIMKFTGHTTVASFMKYIKVTSEERAVTLSEHEFFTGKAPLKAVK